MEKLESSVILQTAGILQAQDLILLDTVDSTNLFAKKLALSGAKHGTAVLAEHQSAGRGRMGRSFLSPEGGLYLSVILRPNAAAEALLPLTALLAVSACDAVENTCGCRPQVKWLNDLVVGKKKLAGILTELVLDKNGAVDCVICGIGVNCNASETDFSPEVREIATGLLAVTGRETDRSVLAGHLIRGFADACDFSKREARMEQYRKDCVTLGSKVLVVRGEESFAATAEKVDADGALWVVTEQGQRKKVLSGEVSVRGMYGYL